MPSLNFQIALVIEQQVDQKIISWLGDLDATYVDNQTRLYGSISDQSALFGLLNRIRDLGLRIVALHFCREPHSDS